MSASNELWFDDVVVGTRMTTPSHTITAADIAAFCDLTQDHHPLHTDEGFARTRGFAGVIAHGLFGLSLMEGLKTSLGLYENSSIASLGWDGVRFVAPVVAGDEVHVAFEFTDKRLSAKGGRGVVTEALQLINQRGECVMQASHVALVACRAAS